MTSKYLVTDVETGGKLPTKNPITQISIAIVDPSKFIILDTFTTFVKPYNGLAIEPEALKYTRVTMKDINNGVDVKILIKNLIAFLKKANPSGKRPSDPILVGHNLEFDLGFLEYLFATVDKNLYEYVQRLFYDTMWLTRSIEAGTKEADVNRYTLEACCERYGITHINAHSAEKDVQSTSTLFQKLIRSRSPHKNQTDGNETERTVKSRDSFRFEI